MINADAECDEIICFYSDCLGTAKFVKMLQEKRCDPQVQEEIESLARDAERLQNLRIMLFVWLRRMMNEIEQAEQICSIAGVNLPQDASRFQNDCLAYFLMTIKTDRLDEYQYES
jgi:hypothetical protein